jgi:hypothetical protein
MTLLEDVRAKLSTAGLLSGWKCYIGFMPDDQAQSICLTYTGGFPQDTHGGENLHVTFQVLIRAGELAHATCAAKWKAIFDTLQDATDISNVNLIQAQATGPMSFVDDKQRTMMSMNFRVVMRNS